MLKLKTLDTFNYSAESDINNQLRLFLPDSSESRRLFSRSLPHVQQKDHSEMEKIHW